MMAFVIIIDQIPSALWNLKHLVLRPALVRAMVDAGYSEWVCGQEFDPATLPRTTIVQTLPKMQDSISHKQEIMVHVGWRDYRSYMYSHCV